MVNLGKATMDHVLFWYYDLKKNITLSTRWKTRLHKHWDINAFYGLKTDCNEKKRQPSSMHNTVRQRFISVTSTFFMRLTNEWKLE